MGPTKDFERRKIDKRFISNNKTIQLFKRKPRKIDSFQKEVAEITKKYEELDSLSPSNFDEYPLSEVTKKGLKRSGYFTPTEIQKEAIGFALKGHDILGAAKTGSGKTLAFILPVLEKLFLAGWSAVDGLGALVITPTRELAYQIFEVLRKVGVFHSFSAALVIGGKDLEQERKSLDRCNILICTPGRLLQHMDENPNFDTINLKILVLDEADRILDLGFQKTVNAIVENLPPERQTLLFSATQTKSVKDLARLSLKNPVYVSVHEHAKHVTPEGLQQSYIVCEAHDKMNMMWSFINNHKKQKTLVFMASCKQVKYTFESFCRLRPSVSIMALYGSLHQLRRMEIYDTFCKKNHAVMFATDVASRGLDFPNVDWVVQLDCPEDVNTYIHRAGRTARYEKGGEALLVLLPTEEKSMVEQLQSRKIPIEQIRINPSKLRSIENKLKLLLARDNNLKDTCERAYKAYLKNMFLMKDKTVFDVTAVDAHKYANSLGLLTAPRVRFLEKHLKNSNQNCNLSVELSKSSLSCDHSSVKKRDTLLDNSIVNDGSDFELCEPVESTFLYHDTSNDACSKEGIMSKEDESKKSQKILTKASAAKKFLKSNIKINTVIRFDENGQPVQDVGGKMVPVVTPEVLKEKEDYSIEHAKLLKEKEDVIDMKLFKDKIKSKHREKKLALKKKRSDRDSGGASAVLGDAEDYQDNASDKGDDSGSDIDPNNMIATDSDSEANEFSDNNSEESDDEQQGSEQELEKSDEEQHESEQESEKSDEEQQESERESEKSNDEQQGEPEESESEHEVRNKGKRKLDVIERQTKKFKIDDFESNKVSKLGRSIEDDEQLALHFLCNS
ncbi:probable ATP-dependent RNA helicase DDX10 [Nephila pilipes]|uniref:ATP-dependent RNA helicase n=1 Tax=Nephila pilipes TaxID=299642 RepID=A0A8X6PUP8_NEPPI|nr:probable ATP-dependent RNA helicase DDX10 [Nephila pilipes]